MSENTKLEDLRLIALRQAGKQFLPDGYWENVSAKKNPACHLTFDDGPCPQTTPDLLALLKAKNIKATFFFTGENAQKHPDLVKLTAEQGHQVGNHSFDHKFSLFESMQAFSEGIDITNNIIEKHTGKKPDVYRPPFGVIDDERSRVVKEKNLKLVYWGAMAEDWNNIGDVEVTRRIMSQLNPGTIIVLHELEITKAQCLTATGNIIEKAVQKGFRFSLI